MIRHAHPSLSFVQVYQLTIALRLWKELHYRSPSLQRDLLDNLRNVALPGTGVPMSWFCGHIYVAFFFIVFINPWICIFAACRDRTTSTSVAQLYWQYLLEPDDWFSLWQINCRMSSLHAYVTKSPGYELENKWNFLRIGQAKQVAVSPFLTVCWLY